MGCVDIMWRFILANRLFKKCMKQIQIIITVVWRQLIVYTLFCISHTFFNNSLWREPEWQKMSFRTHKKFIYRTNKLSIYNEIVTNRSTQACFRLQPFASHCPSSGLFLQQLPLVLDFFFQLWTFPELLWNATNIRWLTVYNCCKLWRGPWRFVHPRGKMASEAKPRVPFSLCYTFA